MLRGITFPHTICTYYCMIQDPDKYVDHSYKKEIVLKAYSYFFQPILNMRMWLDTTNPLIEPQKLRKMPDSSRKNKIKSKVESKNLINHPERMFKWLIQDASKLVITKL